MTLAASRSKEHFLPVSVLRLQCQGCGFGLGYGSPAFLFSVSMTCFGFLLVNICPLKTAMKKNPQ